MIYPDGRTEHGLGGILYNAFGLSRLLGDRTTILPICNVGRDIEEDVLALLKSEDSIESHAVSFVPETNNHCTLTYDETGNRTEKFEGFVPPITFEQMKPAFESSVTIINFISGRDLALDTLRRFRKAYSGNVYIDFHTLSLGLRENGTRYPKKPADWQEYFGLCDYMQMNREEFELLSDSGAAADNIGSFFAKLTLCNLSAILVTLDSDGALMARRTRDGVSVIHEPVPDGSDVTDATGAGDLSASGFVSGLALEKSLEECLKLAVSAGSEGCRYAHPQDIQFTRTSI